MKKTDKCIICNSAEFAPVFAKPSAAGKEFLLMRCKGCGLKFLSQVPDEKEIEEYYKKEYFTKRTERGYDNYFSGRLKNEIERVFKLNLTDLDFFTFEEALGSPGYSLDIGCAAGYFVNFMQDRGWNSSGIDISMDCIDFAKKSGLNVFYGDYLKTNFNNRFHLITLWATIEHLHRPDMVLEKIHDDLEAGGLIFISTCRVDGFNFMRLFGKKWRFYNFPEHMNFFSYNTIKQLLTKSGFEILKYRTYGSNLGKGGSALRKISDFIAKKFYLGDMMIISARKRSGI